MCSRRFCSWLVFVSVPVWTTAFRRRHRETTAGGAVVHDGRYFHGRPGPPVSGSQVASTPERRPSRALLGIGMCVASHESCAPPPRSTSPLATRRLIPPWPSFSHAMQAMRAFSENALHYKQIVKIFWQNISHRMFNEINGRIFRELTSTKYIDGASVHRTCHFFSRRRQWHRRAQAHTSKPPDALAIRLPPHMQARRFACRPAALYEKIKKGGGGWCGASAGERCMPGMSAAAAVGIDHRAAVFQSKP